MTLYEQLIQEGEKKGKIGVLREATIRMILKGADNKFIMEVLNVSSEFINKIRREIEKSK